MTADPTVAVVGAGIAGVSCALALREAGIGVRLLDRGKRIGGRMAVRTVEGRPVDVGASYLTARSEPMRALVARWVARGLLHEWTDTFHLAGPEGLRAPKMGRVRYGTPGGLRSLVEDLADGLPVEHPRDVGAVGPGPVVDGVEYAAVVLAMPDPQARDLVSDDDAEARALLAGREWEPALALAAGWDERCWPGSFDGAFVEDSAVLSWVADDGRRRGDDAPVLVAHSTPVLAASRLDEPDSAAEPMLRELRAVLGIAREPAWVLVQRWSLARPHEAREEAYGLTGNGIGLCGDGWHGPPRIEAAYLSGRALGQELARRAGARRRPSPREQPGGAPK